MLVDYQYQWCVVLSQWVMSEKKGRRVSVELDPVQMVWLQSQHLFQKIEESSSSTNEIKFYKNNNGVQIRFQGNQGSPAQLARAKQQLLQVIDTKDIRLIATSLHKDIYIRISKEARKEFPKSYIIFLHYETFENCARKLQQKFNITSIVPELERLRKTNPYFCFLIAEKNKIDDIEKFAKRILHSQVSCASTTFSHRRDQPPTVPYKRTMSVSSLRGSYSDLNEENYRMLSHHANPVEEQLFEMSESIIVKLPLSQMEQVRHTSFYAGSRVCTEQYEGTYLAMSKKLYFANRLQLTASPHVQPLYAYSMEERTPNHWRLTLVTDRRYKTLSQVCEQQWFMSWHNKIQMLLGIGRGLLQLHSNRETYCGLSERTVLFDRQNCVLLGSVIDKEIPPHTNAFEYDIRGYLMLIYSTFTGANLSYEMLLFKLQREQYFCTLSHRAKNKSITKFLQFADDLFIKQIDLPDFLEKITQLIQV